MADTVPSREEWIAGGARRSLPGFGHTVFVRGDGDPDGAPVTLLHGFPSSSQDWAAVVPALVAAGHRVTTMDFLGLGESDKPYPHAYSVLEQADLVEAVWALSAPGTTALVAHDYGVSVAQELLARDPLRITSMTWLNGGIFPDLHRPTPEQTLLHGPSGPEAARRLEEETFTASVSRLTVGPCPPDRCTTCGWAPARATASGSCRHSWGTWTNGGSAPPAGPGRCAPTTGPSSSSGAPRTPSAAPMSSRASARRSHTAS
ncbi:alpha/beta hydrolase [Streptomyces sp. NPDC005732]|uniref:alpha/beta fold hydrolase n=1 Tax=Streptomyces sp. NPDC005732 TaxID=3157057 RepID=UPI0033D41AF7